MKNKKLVIVGLGETADLAYEYFTKDSAFEVVAFSADKEFLNIKEKYKLPIVNAEDLLACYPPSDFLLFVAIASSRLNYDRKKVYLRLKDQGYKFASYISSKAFVWDNVKIGENCFILENNTLQPFVIIGNNVTLWSGNHIGHRSEIRDHCFITSHVVISGFCKIEENCFMGVNSSIADNVTIAENNFIAMSTAVHKNTKAKSMYIGCPAKDAGIDTIEYFNVKNF